MCGEYSHDSERQKGITVSHLYIQLDPFSHLPDKTYTIAQGFGKTILFAVQKVIKLSKQSIQPNIVSKLTGYENDCYIYPFTSQLTTQPQYLQINCIESKL